MGTTNVLTQVLCGKAFADFAWKSNGTPFLQMGSSEEQVVGNCLSQPPARNMKSVFSTNDHKCRCSCHTFG